VGVPEFTTASLEAALRSLITKQPARGAGMYVADGMAGAGWHQDFIAGHGIDQLDGAVALDLYFDFQATIQHDDEFIGLMFEIAPFIVGRIGDAIARIGPPAPIHSD